MPEQNMSAARIYTQFKGLQDQLLPDEKPAMSMPAIWDSGQGTHSEACDVIITDQRLLGFYYKSFPRERLFIDAVALSDISAVTLRQKAHEPVFRELQISAQKRHIYIRAPRKKIEELYAALSTTTTGSAATDLATTPTTDAPAAPVYARQKIRTPFESSTLAILLLFVGGILMEILGIILWGTAGAQVGIPWCFAGFVSASAGIFIRQRRK